MNRIFDTGEGYHPYGELLALAELCSLPEAIREGLSVDECVGRLKRFHYALKRLHRIFNDHITAEPIHELKMAFSLLSNYCAEHVAALRKRVAEMREPPLGLDRAAKRTLGSLFR